MSQIALLIILALACLVVVSAIVKALRPRPRAPVAPEDSLRPWCTRHRLVKMETTGWTQAGLAKPARDRRGEYGLPKLESMDEMIRFLGVSSYAQLVGLCDPNTLSRMGDIRTGSDFAKSVRKLGNYHARSIPKRGGGERLLFVPKPRLREVQRRILRGILDRVPVHPAAMAFTRGRSVRDHAGAHCGRQVVCAWDIRAFFDSVSCRRVRNFFIWLGYGPKAARILALLCTTSWNRRERHTGRFLPQGAPTSPALANAVCWRMDRRLSGLARRFGAGYTRYADDLAFSGDEPFKRGLSRFIPLVRRILSESGFTANEEKLRIHRAGRRQMVTGLVVNASPAPPRHEYDRLKAILTNARRAGSLESQNRSGHLRFEDHLRGRIAWMAQHRPARGRKLLSLLESVPGVARKAGDLPPAPPPEG